MNYTRIHIILFVEILSVIGGAQQATSPRPAFEVASIRPSQMVAGCYSELPQGGTSYAVTCVSLRNLIQIAYKTSHVQGGGKSLDTYYDLHATAPDGKPWTRETLRPMMQQFLADRFHLVVHPGTQELSGYGLVLAKGGSKLHSVTADSVPTGQKAGEPSRNFIYAGHVHGRGLNVAGIAGLLGAAAHAPVVDHTGLTGLFDLDLTYAAENNADSELPSFFTAVEEQLGLRLNAEKVAVDTVVIDHVDEAPTEN